MRWIYLPIDNSSCFLVKELQTNDAAYESTTPFYIPKWKMKNRCSLSVSVSLLRANAWRAHNHFGIGYKVANVCVWEWADSYGINLTLKRNKAKLWLKPDFNRVITQTISDVRCCSFCLLYRLVDMAVCCFLMCDYSTYVSFSICVMAPSTQNSFSSIKMFNLKLHIALHLTFIYYVVIFYMNLQPILHWIDWQISHIYLHIYV